MRLRVLPLLMLLSWAPAVVAGPLGATPPCPIESLKPYCDSVVGPWADAPWSDADATAAWSQAATAAVQTWATDQGVPYVDETVAGTADQAARLATENANATAAWAETVPTYANETTTALRNWTGNTTHEAREWLGGTTNSTLRWLSPIPGTLPPIPRVPWNATRTPSVSPPPGPSVSADPDVPPGPPLPVIVSPPPPHLSQWLQPARDLEDRFWALLGELEGVVCPALGGC